MLSASQIAGFFMCKISKNKWEIELTFGIEINIKVSYKLILSFLVGLARHAQSTQDNRFAISLQYLQKEVGDEVDFLHVDKHKSFL